MLRPKTARSRSLARWAVRCALSVVVACSRTPGEPLKVPPSLDVVSGAGSSDTIGARLVEPLTVMLRDSTGKPAALSPIVFTVLPTPGAAGPWVDPPALVGPTSYAGAPNPQRVLTEWTDDAGRAAVTVRFGTVAGQVRIAIEGAGLPAHDTVAYTVRPGAAVTLDVQPSDTSIYVGYSYSPRVRSLDRAGNLRDDSVSFAAGNSVVAAEGASRITGRRFGRDFTDVSTPTQRARIWVSVVPKGTLALTFTGYATDPGVGVVNVDGSGRRRIFGPGSYPNAATAPRWSRDGKWLTAVQGAGVFVVNSESGEWRPVRAPAGSGSQRSPAFSVDGRWIYYSSAAYGTNQFTLWRVRMDGTAAAEQLSIPMQYATHQADLSPDGTRMVYAGGDGYLHEMVLADGSDRTILAAHGFVRVPRYSPDGRTITYLLAVNSPDFDPASGVYAVRVDGATAQRITPSVGTDPNQPSSYGGGNSWSPDGEWIITGTQGRLHVVNVKSGLMLPLPWSADYTDPDWLPTTAP